MKMKYAAACAAIALSASFVFVSCDESARLASAVEGSWSGGPEKLIDNSASSATITEFYTFTRTPGTNGGEVMRTALISVTGQIEGTEAVIQPFSLTAGATASIQGTWQAHSDDEIYFMWADSTLQVNVDPKAVTLSTNVLTGQESPSVDSLKPQLAQSIKAQVAQAVEVFFLSTRKFDDVDVKKGTLMDYEVDHVDRHMMRQGLEK